MKKILIFIVLIMLFITGCSVEPTAPNLFKEKYDIRVTDYSFNLLLTLDTYEVINVSAYKKDKKQDVLESDFGKIQFNSTGEFSKYDLFFLKDDVIYSFDEFQSTGLLDINELYLYLYKDKENFDEIFSISEKEDEENLSNSDNFINYAINEFKNFLIGEEYVIIDSLTAKGLLGIETSEKNIGMIVSENESFVTDIIVVRYFSEIEHENIMNSLEYRKSELKRMNPDNSNYDTAIENIQIVESDEYVVIVMSSFFKDELSNILKSLFTIS